MSVWNCIYVCNRDWKQQRLKQDGSSFSLKVIKSGHRQPRADIVSPVSHQIPRLPVIPYHPWPVAPSSGCLQITRSFNHHVCALDRKQGGEKGNNGKNYRGYMPAARHFFRTFLWKAHSANTTHILLCLHS